MAEIVMQFSRNDSLVSRAIQWFGHGNFSHVDTVLPDGRLLGARSSTMGGFKPGVRIRSADYQKDYALKRVTIPCSSYEAGRYYDFVRAQIGSPYDKLAIIAFVMGRTWDSPDSWFCSELNTAALQYSGYLPDLSVPPSRIDPDSLLLILSAKVKL